MIHNSLNKHSGCDILPVHNNAELAQIETNCASIVEQVRHLNLKPYPPLSYYIRLLEFLSKKVDTDDRTFL